MARPEAVTTTVVRSLPGATLDQINEALEAEGEAELTAEQLERRRAWIAQKEQRDGPTVAQTPATDPSPEPPKTAEEPNPVGRPKGSSQQKRSSPKVPRPGTMAEFVCGRPFDLAPQMVWEMALEAGFEGSLKNVQQSRYKYPNLKKRFPAGAGERFTAEDRERAIAEGKQRRLHAIGQADAPVKKSKKSKRGKRVEQAEVVTKPTPPRTVTGTVLLAPAALGARPVSGANGVMRAQIAAAIMAVGLDQAEEVLAELRTIQNRFTNT